MTPSILVAALLAFVVGVAVVTSLARDALVAVVVFAAYSLALAVIWVALRAPDVGLTEAAVGAGVTTSLFLVALVRTTGIPAGGTAAGDRTFSLDAAPRSILAAGAFVVGLLLTVPALPAVGDPDAPAFEGAAAYYLANAPEVGIENAVTAVLVVYRGFDTFGEVAVVFAAGVAVLVVFDAEEP
jgi:multicomponent Na+:H+ antiporter subunit B